jgi:hypothetical protein
VGIIVAVEAVVLYNVFQARLSRVNVELKLIVEEFLELVREQAPTGRLLLPPPETPTTPDGAPTTAPATAQGS